MPALDADARVRVAALSQKITQAITRHIEEWPRTTLDELIAACGDVLQDAALELMTQMAEEAEDDEDEL